MTNSDRLFAKQLKGETGPAREQMAELVRASAALLKEAPWEDGMGDREIIAVDPRDGSERCYCVFMGTLGEVFGMQAYIGDRGFASYRWLMQNANSAGADYLGQLHAVSVEFVAPRELKAADRQAIASSWPSTKGMKPSFRAWRPGYYPWFPNEQETAWLTDCVQAVLVLLSEVRSGTDALWKKDKLPRMTWRNGSWQRQTAAPPQPPAMEESAAEPDREEIERRRHLPRKGVLETTQMYMGATIGKPHERKSLLRVAIVVDAATGFVFGPELGMPENIPGAMLNNALLKAIDQRSAIPAEVRVSDARLQHLVAPLADALRFRVKIARSTPALDSALAGLTQFLGTR